MHYRSARQCALLKQSRLRCHPSQSWQHTHMAYPCSVGRLGSMHLATNAHTYKCCEGGHPGRLRLAHQADAETPSDPGLHTSIGTALQPATQPCAATSKHMYWVTHNDDSAQKNFPLQGHAARTAIGHRFLLSNIRDIPRWRGFKPCTDAADTHNAWCCLPLLLLVIQSSRWEAHHAKRTRHAALKQG